ncbi:RWD domain-containing protein 3 isoform X5 [Embiotoca jacksoni]|uniref:RWD domain-containing protein 3 isoform X5 n=1 Tax=Embiotoca jacksoni TaxID=100190 RepID=UPI003703AD7A
MMSEAALEELSVLSSIYCGEGEFRLLRRSADDGLLVQISFGGGDVSLRFHLPPRYPSCPPDISVSSAGLSRTRCHVIKQKLLGRAAALPPEPMVHLLVQSFQQECVEETVHLRGGEAALKQREEEQEEQEEQEEWTAVLLLDHMRSRSRYFGLLERWSQQLQLTGRVLLGPSILVVLQGARPDIKEFCRRLRTVKVDVDSSGRKCKERMMKVLIENPSSSSCHRSLQGFMVKDYQSSSALSAVFQELHMTELYHQILLSLRD